MKFVTEEELRVLYKKEPFTTYAIAPGARLTPGARQYLADRGISMFDKELNSTNKTEEKTQATQPKGKKNWKMMKLRSKMKSIAALFLVTEEELLGKDIIIAQKVITLGKQFSILKDAVDKKTISENINCQECTGIKEDTFSDDLEDCFEITEFHMQLEKGKEIIILHRLRCALRELEPVLLEVVEDDNQECELYEDIIKKCNQIINTLSLMICIAVGGKECQKIN